MRNQDRVHSQFFVNRVNQVGWASPTKYHALVHIAYFWWAMPTLLRWQGTPRRYNFIRCTQPYRSFIFLQKIGNTPNQDFIVKNHQRNIMGLFHRLYL
ncbi:MAG: hypothetical protein CV087_22020 [Candidatus Brocadia sp. WS118]|nr:MAG: hypothetical protein CV087_22020 [Candidatus Brocadia sp. WS118]